MGRVADFLKRATTQVQGGRKCKYCGAAAHYSVETYKGKHIHVCRSCKETYGE